MDSSPTALFDSYEQDYQQFIESVQDKLEGSGKDEVGGMRYIPLGRIHRLTSKSTHRKTSSDSTKSRDGSWRSRLNGVWPLPISQVYEPDLTQKPLQVSQMEIEIQGIPQSLRTAYFSRLKAAKSSLVTYKKLLTDSRVALARSELLSSSKSSPLGADDYPNSDDPYASDRARLLSGTSLLEDGTKRLQESQRIALETEEQGADILMNLRGQREQIENSRDTVRRAPLCWVSHC